MNSKQTPIILYFFIALLLVAELGMFVFRGPIGNYLINYRLSSPVPVSGGHNINSELDLAVLRDSRIKPLKNYVTYFNYSDLNKSQDALQAATKASSDVAITSPGTIGTTTTSTLSRVKVGNGNPFIILSKTR